MRSDRYAGTSRALLEQAREELRDGDLLQASEKLWGAAAQAVKAVAARRGWPHDGHGKLYEVINRLVAETGDRQLRALFAYAGNLHTNFYENWQPAEFVEQGVEQVDDLLRRLEGL